MPVHVLVTWMAKIAAFSKVLTGPGVEGGLSPESHQLTSCIQECRSCLFRCPAREFHHASPCVGHLDG